MAILLEVDGTETEIHPKDSECFTLEELQKAVGGYIEVVHLAEGRIMLVNEDPCTDNLPYNKKSVQVTGYVVYGNALILGADEKW